MNTSRALFIPVIIGISCQGRMSKRIANFVVEEISKQEGTEAELIDICNIHCQLQTRVNCSKTRNSQQL